MNFVDKYYKLNYNMKNVTKMFDISYIECIPLICNYTRNYEFVKYTISTYMNNKIIMNMLQLDLDVWDLLDIYKESRKKHDFNTVCDTLSKFYKRYEKCERCDCVDGYMEIPYSYDWNDVDKYKINHYNSGDIDDIKEVENKSSEHYYEYIHHSHHRGKKLKDFKRELYLYSCLKNEASVVKDFYDNGYDMNTSNMDGESGILLSCRTNAYECIDFLKYKCDTNMKSVYETSPIIIAIRSLNINLLKRLVYVSDILENVYYDDNRFCTSYGYIICHIQRKFHRNMKEIFYDKNKNGDLVKYMFTRGTANGYIKTLIGYDLINIDDMYCLAFRSCIYDDDDMLRYLLNEGLYINIKDNNGRTLLDMCTNDSIKCMDLLLKYGISVKHIKETMLHACATSDNIDILKLLIKNGSDIYYTHNNRNCLYNSLLNKNNDVLAYLLSLYKKDNTIIDEYYVYISFIRKDVNKIKIFIDSKTVDVYNVLEHYKKMRVYHTDKNEDMIMEIENYIQKNT